MLVLEESEGDGEEFVVDALGDFEPMKGTQVRSDVVVLWNFADDSSEVILDKLKTCKLVGGEIEVEGVAVVELGMYK